MYGFYYDYDLPPEEELPSHETVYMVNGEPGRTIARATKYKSKVQRPFVVKNAIHASMNLWEDLESLCLNHEENESTNLPSSDPSRKQYADLNTDSVPLEEETVLQTLEINGKGFDLGTSSPAAEGGGGGGGKSGGSTPKKTLSRHPKRIISLNTSEPVPPSTKLMKELKTSFSSSSTVTPLPELNESQRLAKKTLLKQSRNNNTPDDNLFTSKQRNNSTPNESDEEENGESLYSSDRNIAQSNKVSWDAKNKQKQHRKSSHSAKKILYSEAQEHKPVEEDGEEERDYGGGPSGITVGGLKEESFEFFSYREAAAREKREWEEKDDVSTRKKHTIQRGSLIHPVEFGTEDLVHLKTHANEVLVKFDVSCKLSPSMFKLRAALVLIQGCRYGIMKVVEFFFAHYSYVFKVDDIFVYNFLRDISDTPHYWFMNIQTLKPTKHTYPVGKTLLHIAASNHHMNIVKYLVENKGANIEVEDCCGYTPLMVSTSNLEIVKYFISKKCNVNHQNRYGITPLMMSTLNCYCKGVVECLVEAGADLLLTDTSGRSGIHYLISAFRHEELEKVMEPTFFPTSRVGYMSYAGLPLFLHPVKLHEVEVLLRTSHVTPSQRVSLKLIEVLAKAKSHCPRLLRPPELFEKVLREGLKYREKMGIEFEEPLPIEDYDNRREAKTEAELDKILSNIPKGSSKEIELYYQALLISDRICGVNSYNSASMQTAIYDEIYSIHMPQNKRKNIDEHMTKHCLKIIERFTKCAKWLAKAAGPRLEIQTLFDHFISQYHQIRQVYKLHKPPSDAVARIHYNFSEAVITFVKNVSYTHIHHSTFSESDRCLVGKWVSALIEKSHNYDWFRPIRRNFYSQLDFSYVTGNHVATLPIDFVSMSGASCEDLREYLEVAGYQWLNKPGHGSFPVQYCAGLMQYLTSYLIDYGAHPDVVSEDYEVPLDSVRGNPYLCKKLRQQLSPPSLSCICARYIATEMKYEEMDNIPTHIKEFISIHDCYGHHALYRKHFGYP